MSHLHGQVVEIDSPIALERYCQHRSSFLDPALVAQTANKIANGDELLFLGNDVAESRQKHDYKLILHGILPCGSKTTLTIDGIYPHVDIRMDNASDVEIRQRVKRLVAEIAVETTSEPRIEMKRGKNFMYYDHNEHDYARVYFRDIKTRADFMALCEKKNIKTFSNDKSSYYRVVARGYDLNLSGWNVLRGYRVDYKSNSKAQYSLRIDVTNIHSIMNEKELSVYARKHGLDPSVAKYENLIVSSFDIEMIPAIPDRFPDANKNINDSIFMICLTYHFVKRSEAMLSVCLTLKPTDALGNVFMVHCRTETCLLQAFAKFMSMMQPDLITEFNGGGFDWRNIITKMSHYSIHGSFLEDMSLVRLSPWEKSKNMINRYHREVSIKIGGATAPSISKGFKMEGFVGFDTLVVFKQLEPNADSHKLNECLRRCNLGSKDAMDVKEMFRIYREGSREEMKLVAHYCYIDTFKLQQLLLKKNVVQDRREVSNLSYTSLYDNFFFAGGSRMRNLLMNRGAKMGYFFDTQYRPVIADPTAKFPGAYVVPPIKGIVKPTMRLDEYLAQHESPPSEEQLHEGYQFIEKCFEALYHGPNPSSLVAEAPIFMKPYVEYVSKNTTHYPISGLDYASLYPSIIMTYNISPEKLVIDAAYATQLQQLGHKLQYISFPFCGEMMNAWFVRHENVEANYSICGKLLIELFARRAELRCTLKHLGESMFEMEQEMKPFMERDVLCEYPRLDEYTDTKFDHACCDSKQKAVKVFMNTLYGEMGNFVSCICAVQVAGGVTTMGRYNLRLAKTFVETELKMKVYYGDTDSLYVTCNREYFIEYDRDYFTGKVDKLTYGTRLVEETFRQIEIAKHRVNTYLITDNGSTFLKMAYEEVLFPAAFLSKKKYFGVPHEENVDFYPRKLFLRGLEVVKRGSSNVLKDVVHEVLGEVMNLLTTRDIIEIVKEAIVRVFNTPWSIDAFAKTKVYRPDKNNIPVVSMITRYRLMNYRMIPEPNVRFRYVICKYYPWGYDMQGKQSKMTIGDRMELVERVIEEDLPIDLEYYFDNELTGEFARLITFCDAFADVVPIMELPVQTSEMNEIEIEVLQKEIYQRTEDTLFKAAKRYIGQLAKKYSKAYVNKGSLFKSTWREVCNCVGAHANVHTSIVTALVLDIFSNKNNGSMVLSLSDRLMHWATLHIAKKYRISMTDIQSRKLETEFEVVIKYISDHELEAVLTDCVTEWKCNIVRCIREEYDYDYLCKSNLPIETLWDVMSRQELESFIRDSSLFPSFTTDQAMTIVEMIASAFGKVLTVAQLQSSQLD
jgi:DNA polymerase elongation subunit (family B)